MAMREAHVCIAQVVGSGICVAAMDGHRVFEVIHDHIVDERKVVLSFTSVTRLTTAFLNTAVGQLYGTFSEETVRRHLAPPLDADPRQRIQLKLVVDRAKLFFRDPEGQRSAFAEIAEIDAE